MKVLGTRGKLLLLSTPWKNPFASAFHHSTPSLVLLRDFHSTNFFAMPRGVKKENLPSKICVTCNRPFTWRKKWERCWDEVTTCSKSCNRKRRETQQKEKRNNNNNYLSDGSENDDNSAEVFFERRRSSQEMEEESSQIMTRKAITSGDDDSVHGEQHQQQDDQDETLSSLLNELARNQDDNSQDGSDQSHGSGDHDLDNLPEDPKARQRALRKAAKKAKKAERRAQREGRGDPSAGQKQCDMCGKSVNLLVRCMYKKGQVDWEMVCGKCWHQCSGGVVDGDANHPYYRYGGLWKNRRAQK